ncbi:hypothetical protein F6B41_01170, partial [Microbacterium lushaniae]
RLRLRPPHPRRLRPLHPRRLRPPHPRRLRPLHPRRRRMCTKSARVHRIPCRFAETMHFRRPRRPSTSPPRRKSSPSPSPSSLRLPPRGRSRRSGCATRGPRSSRGWKSSAARRGCSPPALASSLSTTTC